jgi:acyl-CoA thioesterase I
MSRRLQYVLLSIGVLGMLGAIACGSREDVRSERRDEAASRAVPPAAAPAPAASSVPRVVFLGDSLTAGYGLNVDEAYPALLERRIKAQGLNYQIVNAGVSGDTSAGGLSRLDWALDGDVRVLLVALGGNDGLRALPAEELTNNLSEIIKRAQAKGITVVLAGMEAPPNFGPEYTAAFRAVYPALAARYHVALVPFLLAGVAGNDALNQRDHIHPNIQGAQIVADNVWAVLGPTLQRLTPRD